MRLPPKNLEVKCPSRLGYLSFALHSITDKKHLSALTQPHLYYIITMTHVESLFYNDINVQIHSLHLVYF